MDQTTMTKGSAAGVVLPTCLFDHALMLLPACPGCGAETPAPDERPVSIAALQIEVLEESERERVSTVAGDYAAAAASHARVEALYLEILRREVVESMVQLAFPFRAF